MVPLRTLAPRPVLLALQVTTARPVPRIPTSHCMVCMALVSRSLARQVSLQRLVPLSAPSARLGNIALRRLHQMVARRTALLGMSLRSVPCTRRLVRQAASPAPLVLLAPVVSSHPPAELEHTRPARFASPALLVLPAPRRRIPRPLARLVRTALSVPFLASPAPLVTFAVFSLPRRPPVVPSARPVAIAPRHRLPPCCALLVRTVLVLVEQAASPLAWTATLASTALLVPLVRVRPTSALLVRTAPLGRPSPHLALPVPIPTIFWPPPVLAARCALRATSALPVLPALR